MLLKICGFRTVEEIMSIKAMKIDFIGLNFIEGAQPQVTLEDAESLQPTLKTMKAKTVGLFKDQPIEDVKLIATKLRLDYIQLNGQENGYYSDQLSVPIMRTIAVDESATKDTIEMYITEHPADFYILDRIKQGQGSPVNLTLANDAINVHPNRVFLAGGVTVDTLPEILSKTKPYGFDISGGVRTNGYINSLKVQEIINILNLAQ
jgi:phosphoribosylanthranilate isomerase